MICRPSLLEEEVLAKASATAALAVESRAETARSWWYWAVSCSRRDSCWDLSWFSWSRDMLSMFRALLQSEDEPDDMAVVCFVWHSRRERRARKNGASLDGKNGGSPGGLLTIYTKDTLPVYGTLRVKRGVMMTDRRAINFDSP